MNTVHETSRTVQFDTTLRTLAAQAAAQTYYATYTTPDGLVLQGTAQWLPSDGWLFISEADEAYLTQRAAALALGGRCDIADARRAEEEAAGGLVAIICRGYGQ